MNEFDKELKRILVCTCDLNLYENGEHYQDCPASMEEAIKQLIEKHVIGEDEGRHLLADEGRVKLYTVNPKDELRAEQRKKLHQK